MVPFAMVPSTSSATGGGGGWGRGAGSGGGGGGESVESEMESSGDELNQQETAEYDAFRDWLQLTGRQQIRDQFSNFLWGEHRAGRYPYPPRGR